MTSRRTTPAAVAAAVLLLGGCSSSATRAGDPVLPQRAAGSVTVGVTTVRGLGPVLTDGAGYVLYMFPPDAKRRVTCVGACAGTWPPLAIESGHTPRASGGARAGDLSTLDDPNTGERVVTYAGQPLYRYAGDVSPGVANGQALNLNGGPWYVVNAVGTPLTAVPK